MPTLGVSPGCVQLKIAQGGKNEKVPCQHNRGTGNVLNDPAVLKEREPKKMERNVLIKWGCGGVRAFFFHSNHNFNNRFDRRGFVFYIFVLVV